MSTSITPAQLEEIERRLRLRLGGQARNLRVTVKDGRVVLEGLAASYYIKQLAQHLVLSILGTANLWNEIEVQRFVPQPSDDRQAEEASPTA
jgi:osmotically-inducible protein OsmY